MGSPIRNCVKAASRVSISTKLSLAYRAPAATLSEAEPIAGRRRIDPCPICSHRIPERRKGAWRHGIRSSFDETRAEQLVRVPRSGSCEHFADWFQSSEPQIIARELANRDTAH